MHSVRSIFFIIALGSTLLGSNAQVTTSCNPLEGACANEKGLASSSYNIDFTSVKSLLSEWVVADNEKVTLGANGAELSFTKRYDAPTMRTDFNIFFGRIEYVVKAAPGTGIISSMVMLSDDLDEVDWEFRGSITDSVQTNYFGKGYTGTYNRSTTESVTSPQAIFHTYAVDWSPTALVWSIDGRIMRTLNAADADGNGSRYPQTPMKISLSLWDGGDPDTNSGTVEWAGGLTPLPPTQPWTMYVKSVKIWNSNPGKQYQYSDKSGSWKSIKVINETMTSSSSTTAKSTQTLSLAPTTPISTTYTGQPSLNKTSSCWNTSSVSHHSNGTAMPTLSKSLATSLSPSRHLNSTRSCSTISSSSYPTAVQSTKSKTNATATPTRSTPISGVNSSSHGASSSSQAVQTSYQISQPSAVHSNASLNPTTSPTSSSASSEAAPQTYAQSPSASTIGNSPLAQAAAPEMSTTCTQPIQETPIVSSSTAQYTSTSPSVTAAASMAPSPAVTPAGGSSDDASPGTTESPVDGTSTTDTSPSATDNLFTNTDDGDTITDSPVDSASTTDTSPSATDNPFTNTDVDDGDTITNIPDDNATDSPKDDTTSTTSTTRTTSVTLFVTMTGTGTGTNATSAPYPYTNGSYFPARGSVASTGASGSLSGYAKATSSPLPYALGDGNRVSVGWSLAVVAGTMACFWSLL